LDSGLSKTIEKANQGKSAWAFGPKIAGSPAPNTGAISRIERPFATSRTFLDFKLQKKENSMTSLGSLVPKRR